MREGFSPVVQVGVIEPMEGSMRRDCPMLIALPDGLSVSGVTTWAVRLAGALASRGRSVGLIAHAEPPGASRLTTRLHPDVRVYDARCLEGAAGLEPAVRLYRAAADDLGERGGRPVVLSPNLRGDCYGVCAALAACDADVRLVGWQHSDIEYDRRVLAHFEPVIERFVGVSDTIVSKLRRTIESRTDDVASIPYGVEVPAEPARRASLNNRPLRLIYTGRMERRQKRILSLVHLSDALTARDIEHELVLLGDGPASDEVDDLCASRALIRRVDPVDPSNVAPMLDASDIFVLGSRYEGLSVSMLEAMARGCVPIVARVDSGAEQAIIDGVNGAIADVEPDEDEQAVGVALADAVQRALQGNLDMMSTQAWMTASECYSIQRHADRVEQVLDRVAFSPKRRWPTGRLLAFDSGGGSVPPEGPERLRALLATLTGRRIAIHGTGAHTRMLWPVFDASGVQIVAFCDDDLGAVGRELYGRPVVAPAGLADTGATDVVISSWMHQDSIWERRAQFDGLDVHRIYASADSPAKAAEM